MKFGICTFGETQSTRLQKLHNRAARVIASVPNEVDQQSVFILKTIGLSIENWSHFPAAKIMKFYGFTYVRNVYAEVFPPLLSQLFIILIGQQVRTIICVNICFL